jgi:hypothetical protein
LKRCVAFLALVPLAFGGMHKVWEVQLGNRVEEPAGWLADPEHIVGAIAFSADNLRIALTMDEHHDSRFLTPRLTHLLVLDLSAPKKASRQYDLETCRTDRIEWSPGGDAVYACSTVVQLSGGQMCRPDRMAGFIDGQHYFRNSRPPEAPVDPANYRTSFFVDDLNCATKDSWSMEGAWSAFQVEPHRRLALLMSLTWTYLPPVKRWAWLPPHPPGLTVLSLAARRALEGWSAQNLFGVPLFLIDRGTALCTLVEKPDPQARQPLRCWDLDSGNEIATVPHMSNEEILSPASADSPRLLTQHSTHIVVLPDLFEGDFLRERKVWDIRSGREIASWSPIKQQKMALNGHSRSEAGPVAISPDGKFIAEGANGVVRLYRLD